MHNQAHAETAPHQHLAHGITVIDTGYVRPGFDAAYLLVENGRAAFIDTGVNDSVPRLLQALVEELAGLADERALEDDFGGARRLGDSYPTGGY